MIEKSRNKNLLLLLYLLKNLIFLFIGLLLSGCMRQDNTNSDSSLPTSDTIRITVADFEESASRYEPIIAEFNQQHDTVEVQFVPISSESFQQGDFSIYLDELVTSADTFIIDAKQLDGNYGRFLDLTPLMNNDTTFVADDFWQGALSGCSASPANQFGIPINLGFSMILYDNNAFVEAGITPPPLDWGWHEFLTTAEGLAQKQAGETVRYGFVNTQSSGLFFYPLLTNDTTNQLETTVNEYINLHTAGAVPVPDGSKLAWEQQADMETLVLQRQAAMWTDWQGFQNGRQFSLGSAADIQMLPFPTIGNFTNTTPVSILLCGGISAGTTNVQAAWEWLQFLSTHLHDDQYGRIPARQSLAASSSVWQPQIQPDKPLGYALRHAYYVPVTFDKTAVDALITQVLVGELAIEELLTKLEMTPPVVEAAPQATPVPVATPAPPPIEETAVIRYFADFRTHGDAVRVQHLADQFNASQNHVQVTVGSNVRAASSFGLEAVAAQYDCFSWEPLTRNETAHVYNLDPLLAAETAVSLPISEYDDRVLNQFTDGGTLYAIPANSIPTVIALNATYLAQIGANLPDETWTLDDFWRFAQDMTTEADGQPVYGFTTLQGEEGSIGLLLANGNVRPYGITDSTLTVSYDSPEILTALNQLVNLATDRAIFPAYDIGSQSLNLDNWDRRQQLIVTGKVAMWTNIAGLEEEVSFERIILPLPQGLSDFSPPISTGYYISKRIDDPASCWAWITYLAGQETAVIGVPARSSIAQSSGWKNSVGNREAAVYTTSLTRQLNSALTLDALRLTTPLQNWWNDLLAAAYSGEDVAALLPEAQRKGEIYATCLNNAVAKDTETVTNCAREADPAYKTFQELAQELSGG